MFGSYYGTGPATHTYVDTSQPLSGFGAADSPLTIYEGVGTVPSGKACGCAGSLGRLGTEVLPDGTSEILPDPGVTRGTNVQTLLVGLLIAGSAIAIGVATLGTKAGMRANGKRRRLRRNAKKSVSEGGRVRVPQGIPRLSARSYRRGAYQGVEDAPSLFERVPKGTSKDDVWDIIYDCSLRASQLRNEGGAYREGYYAGLVDFARKRGLI